MTLNLKRPRSNRSIRTAHRLIIVDISVEFFENPTRGSKDIERDGQTGGLTDGHTDR